MERPTAPEADDPLERSRQRRRHRAERLVSRYTGFLLLVMIAQAAFGYALVGLDVADWVRPAHLVTGLVVLGLAWHIPLTARRLPWRGAREHVLLGAGWSLALLASFQFLYGLGLKGWIPGVPWPANTLHVGLGLLITLLVVIAHIAAIGPSLLVSAKREHERNLQERHGGS